MTVDLGGPVDDVDVRGFEGVALIVTQDGAMLGRLTLMAEGLASNGRIPGDVLRSRARSALWSEAWESELRARLHRRFGTDWWSQVPHLSVTVAVCTRDRPAHIEQCLAALAQLDPAPESVLVIDNAPRVSCRHVVEQHGFNYAVEPEPGLDNARNRAIELCETDLIAFTDDDCIPVGGWLGRLDRHFNGLATGAVTGWGSALRLDSAAQIGFEATGGFTRGFRLQRFDWGTIEPSFAGVTGAGANMTFRSDLLRELGGFPPELDAGTPTVSGGDIYVLGRVLAAGMRVVFDPASLIWHDHRADVPELRRVMRGYGLGIGAMASRSLFVDREVPALEVYRWPFGLLSGQVRGLWSKTSALGLLAAAEQARGAAEAPYKWCGSLWRSRGIARPAGRPRPYLGCDSHVRVAKAMNTPPELSVIVPTVAARGAILRRCIASLSAQTLERERYEVIAVPNGAAAHAVGSIAGVDRVVHVPEAGAAGARNAGAESARGSTLVFLDDDIVAAPACLAAHLHRQRSTPGVVLGPAYPAGPLGTLAEQASARWWLDHYSRKHRPGHRFTFVDCLTGNLGLPRELFRSIGGLDRAFGAYRREDWELGCRLLASGARFKAAPEAVAHHHHAPTVSRLLRDALREGYGDVLLVSRHPVVHRDLRLARITKRVIQGRRWPLQVAVGSAVTGSGSTVAERGLAAVEGARLRLRWSALMGRLLENSYRAGVQAALEDGHQIPPARYVRTVVDLDSDRPVETGAALGEITLTLAGEELGHVLAPDGQWDEDEIVQRAIDMLGMPALAAEARRASE